MDDHDVPIVKVEALGPPARRASNAQFRTPIRYHLDDGTTHDSSIGTRLKRDGLPLVASMNTQAERGCLSATFVDGKLYGTRAVFHIGGR